MPKRVSATEARVHFGELMREVEETGQPVIVQRGGKDKVVLVSTHRYRTLALAEETEPAWRQSLKRTHRLIEGQLDGLPLPDPAEVIRKMREERSEHLLSLLR